MPFPSHLLSSSSLTRYRHRRCALEPVRRTAIRSNITLKPSTLAHIRSPRTLELVVRTAAPSSSAPRPQPLLTYQAHSYSPLRSAPPRPPRPPRRRRSRPRTRMSECPSTSRGRRLTPPSQRTSFPTASREPPYAAPRTRTAACPRSACPRPRRRWPCLRATACACARPCAPTRASPC
jgi:hypothetical protein